MRETCRQASIFRLRHWLTAATCFLLLANAPCAAEFSLGVRDSIMVAHSFKSREFGPAQSLHGATFTCDVTFRARKLRPGLNWVLDIGQASELVADVLKTYHLQNLDDLFPEENTTTEWMYEVQSRGTRTHACIRLTSISHS